MVEKSGSRPRGHGIHGSILATPCGTSWKGSFELLLANATHMRNVSGQKTDIKDTVTGSLNCCSNGLLKPSFVPDTVLRGLRELNRDRTSFKGPCFFHPDDPRPVSMERSSLSWSQSLKTISNRDRTASAKRTAREAVLRFDQAVV
jgi:hypothetical protein